MRIGVDLDNTLIYYDRLFKKLAVSSGLVTQNWTGDKAKIRKHIRELSNGEHRWQQLQGCVYGEAIEDADAFSGAIRFLWRAKHKGHKVFIVSHKTKFAHHDSSVNLREQALKWLANNKIYGASTCNLVDDVFFLPTKEKKIEKFNDLKLDVIIDDLVEIIEHPFLDKHINAILFSSNDIEKNNLNRFSSWSGIDNYLLGDYEKSDCELFIKDSGIGTVNSCCSYNKGGNSSVWKVEVNNKYVFSLKYYNNDLMHADRRKTEIKSIKFMRQFGLDNIPDFVMTDKYLETSLFSHINADPVQTLTKDRVDVVVNFLKKLKCMGRNQEFSLASAACLSGVDIVDQIDLRISQIQTACILNAELDTFIQQSFLPLFERLKVWSKKHWPGNDDFNNVIDIERQTLTPSDMGVHNMLEDCDGNIFFIDFEYFGFDDPVKTTSDFLFQPQNKIDVELGKYWVASMNKIFSGGDNAFMERLMASWPLYGLCWCLIMLNKYHEINRQQRMQSKGHAQSEYSTIKLEKLKKAEKLLDFIKLNYQEFPYSK
ncbi:hypothetical protein MNBD_GAMMA24-951 [hydrothermal vent metagenome]|uniref:Aminoglycoside phosphotransferase domain-containing protein n=1 Tax=hydrothermal vent metagenome TaxID=652676 RepID=A0A3B1BJA7_9ZZZZ